MPPRPTRTPTRASAPRPTPTPTRTRTRTQTRTRALARFVPAVGLSGSGADPDAPVIMVKGLKEETDEGTPLDAFTPYPYPYP